MIINTGSRTDIPAFYSEWFLRRVREGFVMVRNPYNPRQVTRYRLDPGVVDALVFCTKNPAPMLPRLGELSAFSQYWHVTITPYGADVEPNVPEKRLVLDSFRDLSRAVGKERVCWRYDPVFLSETYTLEFHREAFARMAAYLEGYTQQAVFSFIDLYEKTKMNFPEVRQVPKEAQHQLARSFAESCRIHGITLRSCLESPELSRYGIDTGGCLTRQVIEHAIGERLEVPRHPAARTGCECLLGNDIGVYNTCGHLCRYCYANYDKRAVRASMKAHDPDSPFLIGNAMPGDVVHEADQRSWISGQMSLFPGF